MPGTCDGRTVATVEDLFDDLMVRAMQIKGSDLIYDLVLLRACVPSGSDFPHQVLFHWEPKSEAIKKKIRDFVPMEE